MTLVFDRFGGAEPSGPGTHALVIGVGDFRRAHPSLSSAGGSAYQMARWLTGTYRNPTAPLASVRLLVATDVEAKTAFRVGEDYWEIEQASFDNIASALGTWAKAASSHPDNLTLFYFAGSGRREGSRRSLLVPSSHSDRDAWIDFDNIVDGMKVIGAHRELFITETEPYFSSDLDRTQGILTTAGVDVRAQQAIFHAAHIPTALDNDSGRVSTFLSDFFDGAAAAPRDGRGAVTVHALFPYLEKTILESGVIRADDAAPPEYRMEGDFDFHYPEETKKSLPPITATMHAVEGDDTLSAQFEASPAPSGETSTRTEFVPDEAEEERDELDRSGLAIGLARRLHSIWRNFNVERDKRSMPASSFVVHIDAPWGGGKTSFANFLARVLNPVARDGAPAAFLRERYPDRDLRGVFLEDPPATDADRLRLFSLPVEARRPWIIVNFNAWRHEHCKPPWWLFYQTIRRQCFDAVASEGTHPWCSNPRTDGRERVLRWTHRRALGFRELRWRLTNPKVMILMGTALVSASALGLLQYFGVVHLAGEAGKEAVGFNLANSAGYALGGIASIGFLWGAAAVVTESVVPGTDTLAERLSLGTGDPFERFRTHFDRTMRALRRPVLVIVDDLDRCDPAFVVDLVRGIQTILRSSRVVFLILGDRDWIERAFEVHHKTMSEIDVGPEQSFGARFVEKAIQMSFILPAIDDTNRSGYVRRILFAGHEQAAGGGSLGTELSARIRDFANRAVADPNASPLEAGPIVRKALDELMRQGEGDDRPIGTAAQQEVEALVSDALAINATVDDRVRTAVVHQLEALSDVFPANPRQIKRIINAITIYWAVALQRLGEKADADFRFRLAIWVTIMTEWPQSWRSLMTCPALADCVAAAEPLAALKAITDASLSVERGAAELELNRILADKQLVRLIAGDQTGERTKLTGTSIPALAALTPMRTRRDRFGAKAKSTPKPAET